MADNKETNVKLTEQEKKKIIELIQAGKTLPAVYKSKLFDRDDTEFIEATKDYRLVYKGKARKEDIIAQTPAAPFQKIRSFNSDNPSEDGWQNMLIFGDNLLALKTLYEDQRGENRYKTKNKIKLYENLIFIKNSSISIPHLGGQDGPKYPLRDSLGYI